MIPKSKGHEKFYIQIHEVTPENLPVLLSQRRGMERTVHLRNKQ